MFLLKFLIRDGFNPLEQQSAGQFATRRPAGYNPFL
jgi:hypothetical protein